MVNRLHFSSTFTVARPFSSNHPLWCSLRDGCQGSAGCAGALRYLGAHRTLPWGAASVAPAVVQHRLCIWQPSIPKPRCLHSPQAPLTRLLQFQLVPLRYEFFIFLSSSLTTPAIFWLFIHVFVWFFLCRHLSGFVFWHRAAGSSVSGWNVLIGVVVVWLPSAPHHFSLAP